jgi:uncharacterized alkaline shock family protein YloU
MAKKEEKVEEMKNVKTDAPEFLSENDTNNGMVRIHENVVVSIVKDATLSVEGVARLSGNSLVNNIAEIVGNKKLSDRSIKVNLDGPEVEVQVEVDVIRGSNIPTVASGIQSKVITDVQDVTGMSVKKVDVIIQDLIYPEENDVTIIEE